MTMTTNSLYTWHIARFTLMHVADSNSTQTLVAVSKCSLSLQLDTHITANTGHVHAIICLRKTWLGQQLTADLTVK